MGMKPIVTDPSLPRISIFFGNPIYVGSFMILPMFLAAFFARQAETPGGRMWYWVLAILQLLAIYLSGTRGAIVGIIIGLFLAGVAYVAFAGSNKVRLWSGVALILFVAAAGTLYMNNDKLPQGSTLRRVFNLQDNNTESRFIQWRTAWQGAKEYWYMGTGPENYYLVANKYHNPEIMKYDPSWFDKPHNFLLEVLVTTGVFGFLAYAAIFVFSIYGVYRAFKAGFLDLLEFLLLVTGVVVYQIQNLFVFDNVSGSLMFFAYTAFCAYLWQEGEKSVSTGQPNPQKNLATPSSELGYAVLGVASLVVAYGVYASNILPMQAAAGVNYGYAYASADPKKALGFFEESVNTPFNFDFGETTSRFAELALGAAYNPKIPKELTTEIMDKSIEALKNTVARVDNNPIYYQRLANLVLVRDSLTGKPFSQEGQDYLNRAIELAPHRTEARMLKAQVLVLGGRKDDGLALAKQAAQDAPGNANIQWQYASMLAQAGKETEAVKAGEEALGNGYAFRGWKDSLWLVDAYRKNKQFDKAVGIFVKLNDNKQLDVEGYWALAQLYAEAGDKVHAAEIARKLADNEPSYKTKAEEFIKKLGQ
jgi:tetratricopeptide (TPR) repeat protein